MPYTANSPVLQDWRNLENVNQNNMQLLDTGSVSQLTAFYPIQPCICSASFTFTQPNQFGLTASTSTTATFGSWASNSIILRFPNQAINGYPDLSGFTNTVQAIFVALNLSSTTITLTSGSGNNYVIATLTLIALDAYNAQATATISTVTGSVPTGLNQIALFSLVSDGSGGLTTAVDNNCIYSYYNNYLPITGGTITGDLTVNGTTTIITVTPSTDSSTKAASTAFVQNAIANIPTPTIYFTESDAPNSPFFDIIFAQDIWVAVGAGGIYYSLNGFNWIYTNLGVTYFTSIAYGDGVFIATGGNGTYRSINGQNWTNVSPSGFKLYSIAYANQTWVAGAVNNLTAGTNGLYYSLDEGLTWVQSNISEGWFYNAPIYANNKFVAGATRSTGSSGGAGIFESIDGQDWTSTTTAPAYVVNYVSNSWVAGGDSIASNGLLYSATDAESWSGTNITSGWFKAIAYGNGVLVACGDGGTFYSTNGGQSWTISNSTAPAEYVEFSNGLFILSNASPYSVYCSIDGKKWFTTNFPLGGGLVSFFANNICNLCTNGGIYYGTLQYKTP